MSNAEKYNFSDFTTQHFGEIIKKLKQDYEFSFYHDFNREKKFVLWRHDVDFSLHRALRCAQIEHEEGVKATYFIHLHSEYYNLFDKIAFDIIKQIISLGHDIGVHFDTHFYDIKTEAEIINNLRSEKNILEELFKTLIRSFSFHNTNPFVMSCQNWEYAGLINAYAEYFQKEVKYCSDSNGYWRFERMMDVAEANHPRLHLLTHCEWWTEEVMSPWQKIQKAIDGRADFNKKSYVELLKVNDKLNIDWN
ncbi:MAG TPA: hypothetical protein VK484_14975 [Ferruginibacter sp.]|nr:hypothetical protein [Ferruginibacter sp.]